MNALWLLIGLLAGAGLAWLVMRARVEHERALGQERLAAVNDAQERLSTSFKALSAEALQASMVAADRARSGAAAGRECRGEG